MPDPIVSNHDSNDNRIDELIAAARNEATLFDYSLEIEIDQVSFDELTTVIPRGLWEIGAEWREAERKFNAADMHLGHVIAMVIDSAQTTEDVNRLEAAFCRWLDVMWITETPVLGKDYIKYRADNRRADLLSGLPYPQYLRSDHWQEVRNAALERAGSRCQVCNSDARLHVHHRTYERRGFEQPEDLIVLCAGCHKLFHDNRRLARRTVGNGD